MKKLFLVVAIVLGTTTTQAQTKLNLKHNSARLDFETQEQLWDYLNAMPSPDSIIVMIDVENGINNTGDSIPPYMVGGFISLYDDAMVYIIECSDNSDFISFVLLYKREIINEMYGIKE